MQQKTTAAAVAPAPGGTIQPPAGNPAPPAPVTTGFNSLSAIYARMAASAHANGATSVGLSPDAWNFYLQSVIDPGITLPDPMLVFPGVDRSKAMTVAQYWAGMSAWLNKNAGLSGLGLSAAQGFYPRSRYFQYGGWMA